MLLDIQHVAAFGSDEQIIVIPAGSP